MHFVYALTDPRTDVIAYIGITDDVSRRYREHTRCYSQSNAQKVAWIKELKSNTLLPGLKILDTVETEDIARSREREWVTYYLEQGVLLTNIALNFEVARIESADVVERHKKISFDETTRLLDTNETLAMLNISRTTLYAWMKQGVITPVPLYPPRFKRKPHLKFREQDVKALMPTRESVEPEEEPHPCNAA